MEFSHRTHGLADRAVKNMATQLAQRGALPPEAAQQMCDGFVSPMNLRQAEQAMALARATGDRTSYQFAKNLHFALGVQMQFQNPQASRREAQSDAFESQIMSERRAQVYGDDPFCGGVGREQPGVLSSGGMVPDCFPGGYRVPRSSGNIGTGLIVAGLFATAVALMSRGRNRSGQSQRRDVHVRREPQPQPQRRDVERQRQRGNSDLHVSTDRNDRSDRNDRVRDQGRIVRQQPPRRLEP